MTPGRERLEQIADKHCTYPGEVLGDNREALWCKDDVLATMEEYAASLVAGPYVCPDCHNQFVQPFVCTTCGAEKLYDATVKSQAETIIALREQLSRAHAALRIIAGHEQCADNLMSDKEIARAALSRPEEAKG